MVSVMIYDYRYFYYCYYHYHHCLDTVIIIIVTIIIIILLHEKFLQFDWLRAVVFQLNLKYLHVKITKLLWV